MRMFTIDGMCPITHKPWTLAVPVEGYERWQAGEKIQHALPTLTADQREMLITGITQEGWEQLFGSEDEDEED